jgi:hypothetical protein
MWYNQQTQGPSYNVADLGPMKQPDWAGIAETGSKNIYDWTKAQNLQDAMSTPLENADLQALEAELAMLKQVRSDMNAAPPAQPVAPPTVQQQFIDRRPVAPNMPTQANWTSQPMLDAQYGGRRTQPAPAVNPNPNGTGYVQPTNVTPPGQYPWSMDTKPYVRPQATVAKPDWMTSQRR